MVAERKNISAINRQFATTTDQSCLNRWLVEAPWDAAALNDRRLAWLQDNPKTRYSPHGVIAIDNTLIAQRQAHRGRGLVVGPCPSAPRHRPRLPDFQLRLSLGQPLSDRVAQVQEKGRLPDRGVQGWSGKEVTLLSPPPLRSVHESFPSHGSSKPIIDWLPQMARPLMAGVLALFAAFLAASNIRQNKPSLSRPMTSSPVARQHPFGSGMSPIQQLMVSLCLSAAGLRFLQPPTPAEDLTLPCGRVTDP